MEKIIPNLDYKKKYIRIDSDKYFVDFYTIDENLSEYDVLVAWDDNGGSAANGYDVPVIPKNQLIPPDVIFAEPPCLTEVCNNIKNFQWSGNNWAYDSDR